MCPMPCEAEIVWTILNYAWENSLLKGSLLKWMKDCSGCWDHYLIYLGEEWPKNFVSCCLWSWSNLSYWKQADNCWDVWKLLVVVTCFSLLCAIVMSYSNHLPTWKSLCKGFFVPVLRCWNSKARQIPVTSMKELFNVIKQFGNISGYMINETKSILSGFIVSPSMKHEISKITWQDQNIRYLGIKICKNNDSMIQENTNPVVNY